MRSSTPGASSTRAPPRATATTSAGVRRSPSSTMLTGPSPARDASSGTVGGRHGGSMVFAVSVIDELLANNGAFADSRPAGHQDVKPRRSLAIVTCMDSRLDVFSALALRTVDAHVRRNAGGVVTDDVIRSLAISQRLLGTRDVMVLQHTECGLSALDEAAFRSELRAAAGV